MVTVNELVATGNYDNKKIISFYTRQVKAILKSGATQSQAETNAAAMVRIYKHTFEIRNTVKIN